MLRCVMNAATQRARAKAVEKMRKVNGFARSCGAEWTEKKVSYERRAWPSPRFRGDIRE